MCAGRLPRHVLALIAAVAAAWSCSAVRSNDRVTSAPSGDDRYTPVAGGWQIRLRSPGYYANIKDKQNARPVRWIDPATGRLTSDAPIGAVFDNPRLHRRPLFPPADKSLVWTQAEQDRTPRVMFRPLIVAYHAPRFLFDYHSAGGLLGHLYIGLVRPGGGDKWFHDWSDVDVRYVDGRMEYALCDDAFPGTTVRLTAVALADSAGLIVRVEIEGPGRDATLVWMYGGASAFFTNYNMLAPQFRFAPEQCAKDKYSVGWAVPTGSTGGRLSLSPPESARAASAPSGAGVERGVFELTRAFDKSDGIFGGDGGSLGVLRFLPQWQAHIKGGSSWRGSLGFGAPKAVGDRPGDLLTATDWAATNEARTHTDCVAVERIALGEGKADGHIVIGMGGRIDECIRKPAEAYQAALDRNESIAKRVVTHTPDPYLDAAMTMMAFATEGTWASQAYVHGGWSWRFAYLGWRILYGPTCYGWTDRVRTTIRNQCRLGRIEDGPDKGGLSSMLESKGLYYNMNEVFFDMVRHYFDYTNDLELMKEIYPVLEGMLERENRRLRPGPECLYESALNTWISDSHWYIRAQCTQASAYMLRAYEFMADLAPRLGTDGKPFREHAGRIREDIQRLLWQERLGVFAECLDTRGNRLLHPEPELPTLYHAAEFGAADRTQVDRMLRWADAHLRRERTPGGGRLYWSSNWFPNNGRSYTHSTYELAYGEELNFAETNFMGGRSDVGYALLRACLSGIFNGPTPGGLSCHSYVDGTQRANDEFADASSMWGRAVVEGLFGIKVKRPDGIVELSPALPSDWPEASIRTPHFSYKLARRADAVRVEWESPVPTAVQFALPLDVGTTVGRVRINGADARFALRKGAARTWLEVRFSTATSGTIDVSELSEVSESSKGSEAASAAPNGPASERAWSPPSVSGRDRGHWVLIDLNDTFNGNVPDVPKRVRDGAIPPELPADQVGFGYWLDHVTTRSKPPCDDAWRAKVGVDGVAWTTDGIPFQTNKTGPNIGAVSLHNRSFPARLSFPVRAKGKTLYLMISGMTHPAQSHVVNLRITLRYEDGTKEARDLVNPFDIGDCWCTWYNFHFDTPANGFENIGGRNGPAGSSKVADLTKPVAVDTIAHLIAFPLRAGARLDTVEMEAIANDVVFGVMGASLLR